MCHRIPVFLTGFFFVCTYCIFVCENAVKNERLQFLLFLFHLKMVLCFSGIFFTSRLLLVMAVLLGKTFSAISFSTILMCFFIYAACGHVCCFWCVHKSMSGYGDSSCAFCRNSYNHFPSICHTFHLLIRKKFPVAYRRREEQVLEEEKEHRCFSPQFGEAADCDSNANNGASQVLSVNDALCPSCKQLLYRPVVLNCGHAFCRSCATNLQNGSLICEVCQSPHPGECSKVCLEFDRFLQEEFPEAYVQRRAAVGQIACTHEGSSICTGTSQTKKVVKVVPRHAEMHERYQDVHFGVGCDTCGAFPIIGKRYRCTGCTEEIGFDMCDLCYNSKSKLPGRFNQQHKPDHSFKLVRPPIIRYNILGFLDDELIEENQELSG